MIYTNADTSISAARSQVTVETAEASSGLRITEPGDDPAAAGGVVVHSTAEAYATAVASTATAAAGEALDGGWRAQHRLQRGRDGARARGPARQRQLQRGRSAERRGPGRPGFARGDLGAQRQIRRSLHLRWLAGSDPALLRQRHLQRRHRGADHRGRARRAAGRIGPAPMSRSPASEAASTCSRRSAICRLRCRTTDVAGINTAISDLQTGTDQISQLRSQVGADGDAR